MATFVLVHGGLCGGWCWGKVAPLLRAAGHDVFTPTLTGMGERAHLLRDTVTLDTHIQDVANVLFYEDLHEVILVGHSYGGMIITGVADRMAEQLAHLVYLDAVLPRNGESLAELLLNSMPPTTSLEETVARWGITDPADVAWFLPRLAAGGSSAAARTQPLALQRPEVLSTLPRTYIRCTAFDYRHVRTAFARAQEQGGWRIRELPTGHGAMVTMPAETAGLLLEVAGSLVAAG